MPRFRLDFMDGSAEMVEMPFGLWVAWFKGRIRAREKGTHLLKVEEV